MQKVADKRQQLDGIPRCSQDTPPFEFFKFFFLIVFAIKMLLDNTYGLLNLLEF
jgi:hypothetical protein